jgi:LysM repeat protein
MQPKEQDPIELKPIKSFKYRVHDTQPSDTLASISILYGVKVNKYMLTQGKQDNYLML